MKINNKGMSLVEIIIVIALISIVTGVIGYNISLAKAKDIEECAKKMTSAIQHCRTVTMGKYDTTITIAYEDNKIVATETMTSVDETGASVVKTDKKVIGKKGLDVTYSVSGGGGGEKSLQTEALILKFNRGNGSLESTNGNDGQFCTKIVISRGAKSRIIEIVPITGRVSLLEN